jgi:hypothetical protein
VNEARRVALNEYLYRLAHEMGLQDWTIHVSTKRADPETTFLEVETQVLTHFAQVRVGGFFRTDDDIITGANEQRQASVHELVHLRQARVLEWIKEGVWRNSMPRAEAELVENLLREELEIMADRLAAVIARFMPPVPDWPEDDDNGK